MLWLSRGRSFIINYSAAEALFVMLPVIHGIIDRRMLLNYRIDPAIASKILPQPFRPKLLNGCGIAGVCLIRLKYIRPYGIPSILGLRSENAAHRIAVEWDVDGAQREGVYIPRRDTSSRLNTLLGGRIFPGIHHYAKFRITETVDRFDFEMHSHDGQVHIAIRAALARALPATSHFESLAQASEFFERGSIGYSYTSEPGRFDGLELRTHNWTVDPLDVCEVETSFFGNYDVFPKGSVVFDCGLLMRNIHHEWHSRAPLCYC